MKKIGILTLVFQNYGTRLQSYALCKAIEKICPKDLSFEVIDMEGIWETKFINRKKLFFKSFFCYGFRGFAYIANLIRWKVQNRKLNKDSHQDAWNKRGRLFDTLVSKIPYSSKKYSCAELRTGALDSYDEILVGSDQVWNGVKVRCQDIYMLDCFKKKGYTYAASFGITHIPKEMEDDYRHRIDNFKTLLVREEEGIKLCETLGRNDAKCVLDPTLLLKGEEYNALVENEALVTGDYVLVYSLNYSYKIYSQAYKLAKRNNCKMVVLKRSFCPPDISKFPGAEELFIVSPEGFLWLIKNAKCVVTNSYHALLFSINFNKNFYLYLDNCDEENSRLLTLVRQCNLNNRVFWETGNLPSTIGDIDFEFTNKRISELREDSILLLQDTLKRMAE
ncbi:polysaccharide pyruvyl transferase family protein [uncultured Fibrobacter sp.]|uniref:polysaccharide pyruvyl transferase family protein n=1 Tax=uncultured Fibrobacter sp. TaxID=261512 RepID=UPI0025F83FBC|nr:polysaccharide pyruvyl transferase family protein [uncultured Fibrobacter sp.]